MRLPVVKFLARIASLVPTSFEVVREGGSVAAIRRDAGERLRVLLLTSPEARDGDEGAFRGRGTTQLIACGSGDARAVFRRYHRGGLLRFLTRDRLFDGLRPFRELAVVEAARADGVPTVEVLAARVERAEPFAYRGELVTRELRDAPDLIAWLETPGQLPPVRRRQAVRALGAAVARLHRARVLHRDLHLKNLLVRDGDPPQAFVIDLDRAVRCASLSRAATLANLRRLDRSVEKLNLLAGARVSRADRLRFLRAYLADHDLGLELRAAVSVLAGGYALRRWRWRLARRLSGGAHAR